MLTELCRDAVHCRWRQWYPLLPTNPFSELGIPFLRDQPFEFCFRVVLVFDGIAPPPGRFISNPPGAFFGQGIVIMLGFCIYELKTLAIVHLRRNKPMVVLILVRL